MIVQIIGQSSQLTTHVLNQLSSAQDTIEEQSGMIVPQLVKELVITLTHHAQNSVSKNSSVLLRHHLLDQTALVLQRLDVNWQGKPPREPSGMSVHLPAQRNVVKKCH